MTTARRDGRYGIQQYSRSDGEWMSCTVWCGYDLGDAFANVARGNAMRGRVDFRVYDRRTGEIVGATAETA